ncbi:MAG TPA: Zn-dependent alcohol dehydrogenase [Mycobacteriales bacterium]|jgi:S-(hydroxymethyl)glutathione dehydrogenase/alcohol dehydrogenase|nr:Zn-dependent alcohol dehydrogenase [Mycobacteriales bacterium]
MVRAAVLADVNGAHEIRDITLRDVGPTDVRVRIAAAGVCHSDLSLANGTLTQTFPVVLGHEGSGTVTAVGNDVTHVAAGDRVVLNWAPPCRACWFCTHGEPWLCENSAAAARVPHAQLDGADVYPAIGTGAFAEETVVPAAAVIPVPDDIPLEVAALLGCAVLTGVGAVQNSGRVAPGETVLVLGLGGVGLSAVQGGRLAGAGQVIAVDVSPEKEEMARRCGATDFVVGSDTLAKEVRALTDGRGVDVALECIGRAATIRQAWSCTRRGGRAVIVGVGGNDDRVDFGALELFHFARSVTGCIYGNTDPDVDVPRLIAAWRDGKLDVEALVTNRTDLSGVDEAFAQMRAGHGGRTLLVP